MTHPLLRDRTMSNRAFYGFATLISLLVAPAITILSFVIASPFKGWE